MTEATQQLEPPKLKFTPDGKIEDNSLADTVDWFFSFDERVAAMRHPHVQELFEWKQQDDKVNGIAPAPFQTAEERFAIGIFFALQENNARPLLQLWITDVLEALGGAKETSTQIDHSYNLLSKQGKSLVEEANKIPTNTEKRIYLTSCWHEALCTAEARILGWVYQELYGVPFEPASPEDFSAAGLN